jgi:hypothetical protein
MAHQAGVASYRGSVLSSVSCAALAAAAAISRQVLL